MVVGLRNRNIIILIHKNMSKEKVIKEIEAYNQRCYDYAMELEAWAEELGPMLKEWRKEKGYSLRKMAEKLEVSTGFYYDVEQGRRGISDKLLEKLKKL